MKLFIGALVAAVALTACGGSEPEPTPTPEPTATVQATYRVSGTFELISEWPDLREGATCSGRGGFSDLQAGFQVRLLGDGGEILDVARFGEGVLTNGNCLWEFDLSVKEGHNFYTVETRRGEFTYTFSEITTRGALAYTLGR